MIAFPNDDNSVYPIVEANLVIILTVNLYLAIIDIRIPTKKLEILKEIYLNLKESNVLCIEDLNKNFNTNINSTDKFSLLNTYKTLKDESDKIIENSFFQNLSLLAVCLLNTLYVLYNVNTIPYLSIYIGVGENFLFIKEIIYIFIIIYYSSKLNMLSSEINMLLTDNVFEEKYQIDQLFTQHYSEKNQVLVRIFGISIDRKAMISGISSFILTLVIGFIRVKILSSI